VGIVQFKRRVALELLVFAVLVSITALVVKPVEAYTGSMMDRLRDHLIGEAERVLNRTIRYASARPSIVGSLDIEDVSVYAAEGESALLKLERFRAEYSVFALLTGKKTGAVRLISLEGIEFSYDLDNDRDLAELFSGGQPSSFILPEQCRLELRQGAVLVKKGGGSLALTDLDFDGQVQDGRVVFDGSWHTEAVLAGQAGTPASGLAKSLNRVTVDGGLGGDFAQDFSGGNLRLRVSALGTDVFELENLVFDFSIRNNIVELRHSAEEDSVGGNGVPGDAGAQKHENLDLLLAYNLEAGLFSGELRPDNFALREIMRFSGDWKRYDPWLGLALDGNVSFSADSRGELRYYFDLRGSGDTENLPAFDLEGSGSGEKIAFERLSLAFSGGTAGYFGDLQFNPPMPEGTLRFDDFGLGEGPGLSGELYFTRLGRQLELFSKNVSVGGVAMDSVSGGMIWEESGCTYTLELLRPAEPLRERPASISVNGSYDPPASQNSPDPAWGSSGPGSPGQNSPGQNSPGQLQGSIALDNFSVADILAMIGPFYRGNVPAFGEAGGIGITTEIFVSTDFEHISYNAPGFRAAYNGFSDIVMESSISGADKRFEVSGGKIGWKDGSVDIALQADFSDFDNASFFAQIAYKDFAYYFEGIFFERRALSIRGSYGISVYAAASESGGYSGYIDIVSAPIPFRGRTARLGLDAALRFDALSAWNLDIGRLELRENENPALQFTGLFVSGTANQDGAYLENLFYEDRLGELSGSVQADWERDFSAVRGRLFLLGENENYILEAAYQKSGGASIRDGKTGRAAFGLQLDGVQLDRFITGGRKARLSGTIDGIWNAPDSYEVDLNLESLEIPGMSVSASASGFMNQDRIAIRNMTAGIAGINAKSSFLALDRSRSVLEMSAEFDGDIKGREIGFRMSLNASFAPIDNWFGIRRAVDGFWGSFDVESAYMEDLRLPAPCSFDFSRSGEDASGFVTKVSGGPGDMLRFELLGDGSLYVDLAGPSPVQASITGTLKDFIIDAWSDEVFIDLPTVWALIPQEDIIVFSGGFITGKTGISGSIFDPEFSGSAWGSGVRLKIPAYVPEEIGGTSGEITLEGNEISFGPLKAACGKGEGEVSVSVRFNRWIPSSDISVVVPEQSPIPFAFDLSGIKAGGNASGNMRFAIENKETVTITGLVRADDTVITLNAEELLALREGLTARMTDLDVIADLQVNAGRRVEFLWPNEDFPVLRAYGAAGTGLRVIADTRIPQFLLDGNLLLQGGEIYYFQRSFFIREGQVFFNPNDPRIDPRISARAEIRDRNDDGQVIISMIIDNAPLSSFTPRFESNPPLSQLEIYSLLGQTPAEGQESEVVVRTFAEALTQFTVIRRVERQIRDILGLDLFTVRTQVLQNALLEAMNNDPEEQRNSTIGNYFDNTAVYMGKYIGSDLFIQAMVAMRYDQYRVENGGLWFEPDIGLDFRTPLVNIRWNISPRHPEHLYVSDQSLSLIWRWSF
jgi:hypothetical protein